MQKSCNKRQMPGVSFKTPDKKDYDGWAGKDSLMLWRLSESQTWYRKKKMNLVCLWTVFVLITCMANLSLCKWHYSHYYCSIRGHINLNLKCQGPSACVDLGIFMSVCPSWAPARAKGECESSSWNRGGLWQGLLKRLLCCVTHRVCFFLQRH